MKPHLLLALGLALALPLHAGQKTRGTVAKGKPNAAKVFAKRDTDGNGFLSKAEFTAKAKDQTKAEHAFDKKDKNHDGQLSPAEFKGGKKDKDNAKAGKAKGQRKGKAQKKHGKGGHKPKGGKKHKRQR